MMFVVVLPVYQTSLWKRRGANRDRLRGRKAISVARYFRYICALCANFMHLCLFVRNKILIYTVDNQTDYMIINMNAKSNIFVT